MSHNWTTGTHILDPQRHKIEVRHEQFTVQLFFLLLNTLYCDKKGGGGGNSAHCFKFCRFSVLKIKSAKGLKTLRALRVCPSPQKQAKSGLKKKEYA